MTTLHEAARAFLAAWDAFADETDARRYERLHQELNEAEMALRAALAADEEQRRMLDLRSYDVKADECMREYLGKPGIVYGLAQHHPTLIVRHLAKRLCKVDLLAAAEKEKS